MLRHTPVIFLDELYEALRSRKIFFLSGMLVILWLGVIIGRPVEIILEIFFSTTTDIPYTLILPMYVSLFLLPLLCVFISYNAVSKELYKNAMRFTASKVSRLSILFGKYLAHLFLITATIFVIYLSAFIYTGVKLAEWYPLQALVISLKLFCFSAVIISISFFVSVRYRDPHISFRLSLLALSIFSIMAVNVDNVPAPVFYFLYIIYGYLFFSALSVFSKKIYYKAIILLIIIALLVSGQVRLFSPFYYIFKAGMVPVIALMAQAVFIGFLSVYKLLRMDL